MRNRHRNGTKTAPTNIPTNHHQPHNNPTRTTINPTTSNQSTHATTNQPTTNHHHHNNQVAENEVVQLKKFQKEQDDIKHIKEFIASCGTYANLVKQAKSKQKMCARRALFGGGAV